MREWAVPVKPSEKTKYHQNVHTTDYNRYRNRLVRSLTVQRQAKIQVHTSTDSEPTEQVDLQNSPQKGN